MASRLRSSPSHLFDLFAEICYTKDDEGPFIRLKYPDSFAEDDVLKQLPSFAFPCEPESRAVEHFTFTLTDIEGKHRFGFCRLSAGGRSCLCFISWLPWFDVFYKILNKMSDLLKTPDDDKGALPLLAALLEARVPSAGESCYVATQDGTQEVQFEAPRLDKLPSVISDRNLTEYCSALDYHKQIVIFASLLNERRIIFTSLKISRLSACVHACAALIYPMHWQHIYLPVLPRQLLDYCSAPMPYLIGVHTYLKDNLRKMDIGDAVIVDADRNEILTTHPDVEDLPHEVYSALKKRLKVESGGDNVSRSCLRALVMLIGGYREGTKWNGKSLEFNDESFLASRPASMRPFLEKMLDLQIFRQFVDERIDLLNRKKGYHDEFENEILHWSAKASSNSKHKLMASAKKFQKDSRDQITGLASVVRSKGKNAVKSIKRKLHDDAKPDDGIARRSRRPQRMNSYKQSMADETDAGATGKHAGPRLLGLRPPRPPLPHSVIDGHTWMKRNAAEPATPNRRESYNKARHYNPLCFDEDDLAVSRVSINLVDDPDIQSVVKKSFSMEDITAADTSEASDSSSDASDTSGDLLAESDVASIKDGVGGRTSPAPVPPPRRSRDHQRRLHDPLGDHTDASSINSNDSSGSIPPSASRQSSAPGPVHDLMDLLAGAPSNAILMPAHTPDTASILVDAGRGSAAVAGTNSDMSLGSGGSAGLSVTHTPADAGKAVPLRRAAPRIEQLQKELIERVQYPGVPMRRPVTAPASAAAAATHDGSSEAVQGSDGPQHTDREPQHAAAAATVVGAHSLNAGISAGSSVRKDSMKRQTIFGDPRNLALFPPAEEDEEACLQPPTVSPAQQASTEAPAIGASITALPDVDATPAAATDIGLQLHEDLVGLQLSPPLSPHEAAAASAAPKHPVPAAPRPNYFVSLPPVQPGSPYHAGSPRMGSGGVRQQSLATIAASPLQLPAGGMWLPPAAAAASPPFGRGGAAVPVTVAGATGNGGGVSVQQQQPVDRARLQTAAALGHFGQAPEPAARSSDLPGGRKTAEQQPPGGVQLRPKSAFPTAAKLQAASSATTSDPFADLVNLKSHLGATPAAQL